MIRKRSITVLTLAILATTGVVTGQEAAEDPIAGLLFPPELIMRHQAEIELSEAAGAAIRSEVTTAQHDLVDLQWRLQSEVHRLVELLEPQKADEEAILAQADRVMELERAIKSRHLAMLVRIRNMLGEDQRARLRSLRDHQQGEGRER